MEPSGLTEWPEWKVGEEKEKQPGDDRERVGSLDRLYPDRSLPPPPSSGVLVSINFSTGPSGARRRRRKGAKGRRGKRRGERKRG
jgi:hypothetical protein